MLTLDQFDPGRVEALLKEGKVDDARTYREECLKRAAGDPAALAEVAAKFDEITQRVTASQGVEGGAPVSVSAQPGAQTPTIPSPSGPETSTQTSRPTGAPGEGESAAPPPPPLPAPGSVVAATPAPPSEGAPAPPSGASEEIKVPEVAREPLVVEPEGIVTTLERIEPIQAGKVVGELKKLEPVQLAGLLLALGVGSVIAVVTGFVLVKWIWTSPWTGVPPNLSNMTPDQAKALVENIKSLSDVASTRCLTIFDAIVTKALLPVFTSILGYIFGTRAVTGGSGGQSS